MAVPLPEDCISAAPFPGAVRGLVGGEAQTTEANCVCVKQTKQYVQATIAHVWLPSIMTYK